MQVLFYKYLPALKQYPQQPQSITSTAFHKDENQQWILTASPVVEMLLVWIPSAILLEKKLGKERFWCEVHNNKKT